MNKEQVYDEMISPLMQQILTVCGEHNISLLCTFAIPTEKDPTLCCTSMHIYDKNDPLDASLAIAFRFCMGNNPIPVDAVMGA